MNLCNLTHEQKLALVALTEAISISDGAVSESEGVSIDKLATALGDTPYRELISEAEARFASIDELKEFLDTIEDRDAQELIYGTILDEVISGMTIDSGPSELLRWLAATWGIETVESEPTE